MPAPDGFRLPRSADSMEKPQWPYPPVPEERVVPLRPASADAPTLPAVSPAAGEVGPSRSDRELIEATQAGDREAFGMIVRKHQTRIFKLAYRLVRCAAEAEDVTQETFVRAYQAIGRFDSDREPLTWLYRIAVNLSLNSIRDRKAKGYASRIDDSRIEGLVSETRLSHGGDPARASHERQRALAVCDGIERLSETLRTTLVLVCLDGLEHTDVAANPGVPRGNGLVARTRGET